MAELGITAGQSFCYYCRSTLLSKEEKNQGHHNTCKYEISQYKEELGYWYYLQLVNATTDDCVIDAKGRIIKLDLSYKGLADLPYLPFKDIQELNVSNNLLDRVPDWVFELPRLKKMIFPRNGFSYSLIRDMLKLNEKGVTIVSTGLKFVRNVLKTVNFPYVGSFMRNNLSELPEEIIKYFFTVKNVNIAFNRLEILPEWVIQIKGLEELNIADNYFSDNEYRKLLQMEKLKRILVSPNDISGEMEYVLNKLEEKRIIVTQYESQFYW